MIANAGLRIHRATPHVAHYLETDHAAVERRQRGVHFARQAVELLDAVDLYR
jgi:hypothetical protein